MATNLKPYPTYKPSGVEWLVVHELTGKRRGRLFAYSQYVAIFSERGNAKNYYKNITRRVKHDFKTG